MVLPTGTISMSQVNTEIGRTATAFINLNEAVVRSLAGIPSGAISLNDLRGKSSYNAPVYTPSGGATAGTAEYLSSDISYESAEISISANRNVTWNYSMTGGGGSSVVSVSNGGVSSSIIFSLASFSGTGTRQWSVTATDGTTTRYWTVNLRVGYVDN